MNSVDLELEKYIFNWKEQEAKYSKLFSSEILKSKAFKTERLKQLLAIQSKFKKNTLYDPSVYSLIKAEKKQLEKQLSSGFISLLLIRIKNALRSRRLRKKYKLQKVHDVLIIREALKQVGFEKYSNRLEKMLLNGNGQNTFSYTEQIAPKQKIEYNLNFTKTEGVTRLDNYKVIYIDENATVQRQQVFHDEGMGFMSGDVAGKLLSGKSLKEGEEWLQMDFNDKDKSGNYKLIRFVNEKFDDELKVAISKLPIKKISKEESENIFNELCKGNPVNVNLVSKTKEIQAAIHANPRHLGILVLDNEGKVLDPLQIKNEANDKSQKIVPVVEKEKLQKNRMKLMR